MLLHSPAPAAQGTLGDWLAPAGPSQATEARGVGHPDFFPDLGAEIRLYAFTRE